MTGEKKYLEYAERLADYYLLPGDFVAHAASRSRL